MAAEAAAAPVAGTAMDIVVLHQYPRTVVGPSPSPFALKLETYLRMAKQQYQNDFSKPQSSKGKTPWLTYGGQDVADSAMAIEYLKLKTGQDFNLVLSSVEKGISRAFQKMIEEELYWVLVLWRWFYDKEESLAKVIQTGKVKGYIMTKLIKSNVKKEAMGQGIGRHTQAEVMKIGEDDITAVGEFLGNKKFMMGDDLTDIDCSLFGLFAQFLYVSLTCPLSLFIRERYANIVEYCDRIKTEFWPDWEQICLTVKTEKESRKAHKTISTSENIAVMNGNGTLNGHGQNGLHNGSNGETSPLVVAANEAMSLNLDEQPALVMPVVSLPDSTSDIKFEQKTVVTMNSGGGVVGNATPFSSVDLGGGEANIPAMNGGMGISHEGGMTSMETVTSSEPEVMHYKESKENGVHESVAVPAM